MRLFNPAAIAAFVLGLASDSERDDGQLSGASEQDAETRIVTILSDGVKGIRKQAIAAL